MNKRFLSLIAMLVITLLVSACGVFPNTECKSGYADWQGHCTSSSEAPAPAEPAATQAPAIKEPDSVATEPPAAAPAAASANNVCHGLTGPGMEGVLEELSERKLSHDGPIHVEFWTSGPEREGLLDAGTYTFAEGVKGYFWYYHPNCTEAQVTVEINDHIDRRIADKADNAGWASEDLVKETFTKQ